MRAWLVAALLLLSALVAWWFRPQASEGVRPRAVAPGAGLDAVGPRALASPPAQAPPRVAADGADVVRATTAPPPDVVATTHLTLRVLQPDGTPWNGGRLRLSARRDPLAASWLSASGSERRQHGLRTTGFDGSRHYANLETDAEGRVSLPSVTADLPLRVEARDATDNVGAVLEDLVLRPGERRGVDLHLDAVPRPLRGRCVDVDGLPVADVRVSVRSQGFSFDRFTLEDGTFECEPMFGDVFELRARHGDRIALARFDRARDGAFAELALARGRSLHVETIDVDGAPVLGAQLAVHAPGFDLPVDFAARRSEGEQDFETVPAGPLELRWGAPCAPHVVPVDADACSVVVQMESSARGTIEILIGPLPGDLDAEYAVGLRCEDGLTDVFPPRNVLNAGHQQHRWPGIDPGRYLVQLLRPREDGRDGWVPFGSQFPIEVLPGATTVLRLGN